eukprot:g2308.t1
MNEDIPKTPSDSHGRSRRYLSPSFLDSPSRAGNKPYEISSPLSPFVLKVPPNTSPQVAASVSSLCLALKQGQEEITALQATLERAELENAKLVKELEEVTAKLLHERKIRRTAVMKIESTHHSTITDTVARLSDIALKHRNRLSINLNGRRTTHFLRDHFLAWAKAVGFVSLERRSLRHLEVVARRFAQKWLHASFQKWFQCTKVLIVQERSVSMMGGRLRGRAAKRFKERVFRYWADISKNSKTHRNILASLLQRMRRGNLWKGFNTWLITTHVQRTLLIENKKQKGLEENYITEVQLLREELSQQHELHGKRLLAFVCRRLLHRHLHIALRWWVRFCNIERMKEGRKEFERQFGESAQSAQERAVAEAVAQAEMRAEEGGRRHGEALARQAFAARDNFAARQLKRMIASHTLSDITRAFFAWRRTATRQRHVRDLCRQFVLRGKQKCLAHALRAWQVLHLEERRKRTIVDNFIAHWKHHDITKVMNTWRSFAARRRRARHTLRALVARWRNRSLTAAMHQWWVHGHKFESAERERRMKMEQDQLKEYQERLKKEIEEKEMAVAEADAMYKREALTMTNLRTSIDNLERQRHYFSAKMVFTLAEHSDTSLQAASFRAWVALTRLAKQRRSFVGLASGLRERELPGIVFRAWKAHHILWMRLRRLVVRLAQNCALGRIGQAWIIWRDAMRNERHRLTRIRGIVWRLRHRTLAKAIDGWRYAAVKARRRRLLLGHFGRRIRHRRYLKPWLSLVENMKKRKHARSITGRLLRRMLHVSLYSGFRTWHENVDASYHKATEDELKEIAEEEKRKHVASLLRGAFRAATRRTTAAVLSKWREMAHHGGRTERALRRVFGIVLHRELHAAFRGWLVGAFLLSAHVAKNRNRLLVAAAANASLGVDLTTTLDGESEEMRMERAVAEAVAQAEMRAEEGGRRHGEALARQAFAARDNFAARQLKRMIASHTLSDITRAFFAWRRTATRQRHVRDLCRQFVLRGKQKCLAHALRAWQVLHLEERRKRTIVDNFIAHWKHHDITKVMNTWRSFAARRRRARHTLRALVARWRNRSLTAAMHQWWVHGHKFESAERARLIAQAHESRLKGLAEEHSAKRSQGAKVVSRIIDKAARYSERALLHGCIVRWARATALSNRRRSLMLILFARIKAVGQLLGFRAWQRYHGVRGARQHAMRALVAKWRLISRRHAFSIWSGFLHIAREGDLKRELCRKALLAIERSHVRRRRRTMKGAIGLWREHTENHLTARALMERLTNDINIVANELKALEWEKDFTPSNDAVYHGKEVYMSAYERLFCIAASSVSRAVGSSHAIFFALERREVQNDLEAREEKISSEENAILVTLLPEPAYVKRERKRSHHYELWNTNTEMNRYKLETGMGDKSTNDKKHAIKIKLPLSEHHTGIIVRCAMTGKRHRGHLAHKEYKSRKDKKLPFNESYLDDPGEGDFNPETDLWLYHKNFDVFHNKSEVSTERNNLKELSNTPHGTEQLSKVICVCVPCLGQNGRVLGVLQIVQHPGIPFSPEQLCVAEVCAHLFACALEDRCRRKASSTLEQTLREELSKTSAMLRDAELELAEVSGQYAAVSQKCKDKEAELLAAQEVVIKRVESQLSVDELEEERLVLHLDVENLKSELARARADSHFLSGTIRQILATKIKEEIDRGNTMSGSSSLSLESLSNYVATAISMEQEGHLHITSSQGAGTVSASLRADCIHDLGLSKPHMTEVLRICERLDKVQDFDSEEVSIDEIMNVKKKPRKVSGKKKKAKQFDFPFDNDSY